MGLTFDVVVMMTWLDCETELQSKRFLHASRFVQYVLIRNRYFLIG
jgi:hypothetical protein